ncbi:MAG: ATP-binding protein [Pseudomonadota bacterium]|nr:ATP-binding protein [Pseudomonadota bacterium]
MAFAAMDEAVAVTIAGPDGPRLLAASERMRHLCGARDPLQVIGKASLSGPATIPGLGTLIATPLAGGATLWRLQPVPVTGADPLVDLIRDSRAGGVALMYFDPQERLRSWNRALANFFPDYSHFPVPGGTFEDQLDAIIANNVMPDIEGRTAQWRANLVAGFRNPMRPFVDRVPGGGWAIAVTCRLSDGSSIHIIADVSVFKEREEQLKSFMANAEGMLFTRRREGSRDVSIWGKPARDLSPPGQSPGKDFDAGRWHALIHEGDRAAYVATMEAHRSDHRPYALEFRWTHPLTGRQIWSREEGWVTVDRHGERYFDSLLIDITARKQAEIARNQSESRFRDFAELATDWFWETDANLDVIFVSGRYGEFDPKGPESMMGVNAFAIAETHMTRLGAEERRGWEAAVAHWRTRSGFRDISLTFAGRRGTRTFSVSQVAITDDAGRFTGMRGVCRDVTQLIRARATTLAALERAEQANSARSSFIANMSHELRTPLNAIIGFANVMATELMGPMQNPRYKSYARDIADSGEHLLSLVNDILDLSKIDADRYVLSPEQLDLAEEVHRAVNLAAGDRAGTRLRVHVAADMPPLLADRRAFRQMLLNLVGNAVKFSGPTDAIEIGVRIGENGAVIVEIRDEGRGIRPEDIERVLEPFGRAHDTDAIPGTGLGLPLTARLVELHGGRMTLDSEPGRGTCARLIFPPQAGATLLHQPGRDPAGAQGGQG